MATEGAELKAAEAGAAPPSYSDAKDVAPPPSYDSLFGKIKQAKEESDGNVDFVKTCCGILVGSVACTICLGIFLAIPIAMIAVGATYLHDCPAERMIPIYLIVAGVFNIVSNILMIIRGQVNKRKEGEEEKQSGTGPEQIINCFLFAWFIAGNVWVYRTYDDWQSSNSMLDTYCNPTLYYFSFWIITSTYIVMGLLLVICLAVCICMCVCGKKE